MGYIPARAFCGANPTYRPGYADILSISASDEFPIVESRSGFIFSGWNPPDEFLAKVYDDVIDHSKTITETVDYRRGLLELAAAFLRIVEQSHPSSTKTRRLLDFGCGYGSLTRMLHGRDIKCCGYDPSAARLSRASQAGVEVSDNLESVAEFGPFDLLICTDVLEHVANPREVLRYLNKNASPGALLAITVPQCEPSFMTDYFAALAREGTLSRLVNPWEHLNYFSASSLRGLLAEEGFTPVHDHGRTAFLRETCLQMGDSKRRESRVRAGLRIARTLTATSRSTQLICRTDQS